MVKYRGSFGMVLEGGKFGTTQNNWEGRILWEKPSYQSFAQI